ncbi:MAG: hypothetical protein MJZ27_00090 [Bacteroidales bacterium]|nr:hypothetical protein [Bacteroidales bacterium]
MKKLIVAVTLMFFPTNISRLLFRMFGCNRIKIGKGCKIGFSLIIADHIDLCTGTKIGHLNVFRVKKLDLADGAYIKHLNIFNGGFVVRLMEGAWIHSMNKFSGQTIHHYQESVFLMKEGSSIMMKNEIDLSDNITIGEHAIIAGAGSQIWTHAFYQTRKRVVRVDGDVEIGDYCYVGSNAVICSGVHICADSYIGANATVAKDITVPGLYVSQPLRYIDFNPEVAIDNLEGEVVPGTVYKKKKVK